MASNFVLSKSLDHFVAGIKPIQIRQIGSKEWLELHKQLIRLCHQALIEASEDREEMVKEKLIFHDKIRVIVHEAYCVSLWKNHMLPRILEINPNPPATYFIYTILFHEGVAVSLLDTVLHQITCCEAFMGAALDLIDYCANGLAELLLLLRMYFPKSMPDLDVDENIISELERLKRNMLYRIGMRCISILSCLSDNMKALPISAIRRMVCVNDIPFLMADVLRIRPWERRVRQELQRYMDDIWVTVADNRILEVIKQERQAWICFRQLLFNQDAMKMYQWNEIRRVHLGNCLLLLNENIMNQIPQLIDLEYHLITLIIKSHARRGKIISKDVEFEVITDIKFEIMVEVEKDGGFIYLAEQQAPIFLCSDKNKVTELAREISSAYDIDLHAVLRDRYKKLDDDPDFVDKPNESPKETSAVDTRHNCTNCAKKYCFMKCGGCYVSFYCSKVCQRCDWPQHKKICAKLVPRKEKNPES